jgi:hypothetical protein
MDGEKRIHNTYILYKIYKWKRCDEGGGCERKRAFFATPDFYVSGSVFFF